MAVKASSVDRSFSMPKLVKKLGEFEKGDYPKDRTRPKPEPIIEAKSMFEDDWCEYRQEKEA